MSEPSPIPSFFRGAGAPLRGLRAIRDNPPLYPYAVAPAIITGLLLFTSLYVAITGAGPFTRWLLPGLVRWWVLFLLARSAMLLLLAIVLGVLATMTAALVCLPIHDALSQKIEALRAELPAPISFREALPRSIAHSLLGFGLWVVLQTVLTPLQLVPGIGWILELVLGFGLTAFFLAHQLMDGPMSRRRMSFVEKMTWMRAHLVPVLGLGTVGTFMVALPLVNAIGLPIAIAGGALLFVELEGYSNQTSSSSSGSTHDPGSGSSRSSER